MGFTIRPYYIQGWGVTISKDDVKSHRGVIQRIYKAAYQEGRNSLKRELHDLLNI